MEKLGPPLEHLTHRIASTPADFLQEPIVGPFGQISTVALVSDLLRQLGGNPTLTTLAPFRSNNPHKDRNWLALVNINVWLLSDEWLLNQMIPPDLISDVLRGPIVELAMGAGAHQFVDDPDRCEELARTVLAGLRYRPDGETVAQASDRLVAISGAERKRLIEASRGAEERARIVREALARKAAEESADKWTRE